MDPHIFADPDPGSQNLADPTDPDPKHWFFATQCYMLTCNMERENFKLSLFIPKKIVKIWKFPLLT